MEGWKFETWSTQTNDLHRFVLVAIQPGSWHYQDMTPNDWLAQNQNPNFTGGEIGVFPCLYVAIFDVMDQNTGEYIFNKNS